MRASSDGSLRMRGAPRSLPRLMTAARAATSALIPPATDGVSLRTLEDMRFDNTFVRELPADPLRDNRVRQVHGALHSLVDPTPTHSEPHLVAASPAVAALLGLRASELHRPEFPLIFSGQAPLPGSQPYAQCYGGHQFGSWAGQLGDGRAITLGEVVNAEGQRWELQLKGAGRTPYSRHADGRAVMRSSLREYVASEAMAALGVPTTRALCLVGTGEEVLRDMFYNGNRKMEPGAVVCRVAPSFIRFGTFQLPVSRGGEEAALARTLADYVIRHHYPHLQGDPQPYAALFREVAVRTARTVALWQSVGFVHGVLNTDNMSILGVTIDYGPYGFLDTFDPAFTPNTTDMPGGRYAYRQQPAVCQWNLAQLANALLGAELAEQGPLEAALEEYGEVLLSTYNARTASKLGLPSYDKTLSVELLTLMAQDQADFTNTWRALSHVPTEPEAAESSGSGDPEAGALPAALQAALPAAALADAERREKWAGWVRAWRAALRAQGAPDAERQALQRSVSPKFVPRQHLLQYAIEGVERGDASELEALLAVLAAPYDEQPGADPRFSAPPPPEMVRPGVCYLSCSS